MFHSLFSRLLVLFMVVILLVASTTAIFSSVSIRNEMIDSRMESLLLQARDIAYLASQNPYKNLYNGNNTTMQYLQWKAEAVHRDYGAYIFIVDSKGRAMHNLHNAQVTKGNVPTTLNSEDLSNILLEVLKGKEIRTRIQKDAQGTIFTVAVPWEQDNEVTGAVLIHTSAQIVDASLHDVFFQMTVGFFLAAVVAILSTAFYARSIINPLTIITKAAEQMSRGKLNTRAEVTGVDEVRQLAGTFNMMAEKLEQEDENRKEFVANVSHELRSPVTSIHGFVEGILDGVIPQNEQKRYLQIVFDETNRMKRLITELLELSRMDKGVLTLQYTLFDLNELIRRTMIGKITELEHGQIEVHMNFAQEPCIVYADSDRIAQVVVNILDNALKYIPQKGNLTIHTSLLHDKVCVDIINDGPAIEPQDKLHLFERFYKADKAHTSGKGTGLGLSICKQIIDMHEQTIEVLPLTEGAGFRFTLKLQQKEKPRMLQGK